jgi:hypothetical protein
VHPAHVHWLDHITARSWQHPLQRRIGRWNCVLLSNPISTMLTLQLVSIIKFSKISLNHFRHEQ